MPTHLQLPGFGCDNDAVEKIFGGTLLQAISRYKVFALDFLANFVGLKETDRVDI